jgi:hypothetical protein
LLNDLPFKQLSIFASDLATASVYGRSGLVFECVKLEPTQKSVVFQFAHELSLVEAFLPSRLGWGEIGKCAYKLLTGLQTISKNVISFNIGLL